MAGFFSGLVNAASAGATGHYKGQAEGEEIKQAAIVAALKRKEAKELHDAQIRNYDSQVKDREYDNAHPKPAAGGLHLGDPGHFEAMQKLEEMRGRIRTKNANARRAGGVGMPETHAMTGLNAQIDDNARSLTATQKRLDTRFSEGLPDAMTAADTSDYRSLSADTAKFHARGDSLSRVRDRVAAQQQKALGIEGLLTPLSAEPAPKPPEDPKVAARAKLHRQAAAALRAGKDTAAVQQHLAEKLAELDR